jgi:hypothetical protein
MGAGGEGESAFSTTNNPIDVTDVRYSVAE